MADLSHWDFAENFSGYDAAALILGFEPRESEDEQWRVRVVTERMELHYKYAITRLFHENFVDPIENVELKEPIRIELLSVKLNDLHRRCWLFSEETPLSDWLADKRLVKFENQEFERYSIARWVTQIGMKSVYQFDRNHSIKTEASIEANTNPADQSDTLSTPAGRWPWGNHHTELLGHLEAAAREFWAGYDPQNAKATAPKNETVIAWLKERKVKGRNVSDAMANAIATMLRADDLPTGPRK